MVNQAKSSTKPASENSQSESLKTVQSSNNDVMKLQENLTEYFNGQRRTNVIEDIKVKAGSNRVAHKNNKQKPSGYIVIKQDKVLDIFCESIDNTYIILNCSADGSISIMVVE